MATELDLDGLSALLDELATPPKDGTVVGGEDERQQGERALDNEELDRLMLQMAESPPRSQKPSVPAAQSQASLPLPLPSPGALENSSFDFDSHSPVSRPPSALPANKENVVGGTNGSNGSGKFILSATASGDSEQQQQHQAQQAQLARQRCSRVVLAGPCAPRGLRATAFSKNVCDRLLCLKCNFSVAAFPAQRWRDECDYLFIRTHRRPDSRSGDGSGSGSGSGSGGGGDPGKLATMLEAQPDSCAYCCQCGFASVAEEQELRAFAAAADAGSLGWVCGGHTASASASASASAAAGAETAAEALA